MPCAGMSWTWTGWQAQGAFFERQRGSSGDVDVFMCACIFLSQNVHFNHDIHDTCIVRAMVKPLLPLSPMQSVSVISLNVGPVPCSDFRPHGLFVYMCMHWCSCSSTVQYLRCVLGGFNIFAGLTATFWSEIEGFMFATVSTMISSYRFLWCWRSSDKLSHE